jgi:hypothetical protein
MSDVFIPYQGLINFNIENITKKHNSQNWKSVGMVLFPDSEIAEYYSNFLFINFGIKLNKNLRGSHITFLSDNLNRDSKLSLEEQKIKWEYVNEIYNEKNIIVDLNINKYSSNGHHWWLSIKPNEILNKIRTELGLGESYFTYHLTLGYVNERNKEQSDYILNLAKKGFLEFR